MAANYGVLLEGQGQGQFVYVPQNRSGFSIIGDVHSIVNMQETLLFGRSEGLVLAYRPVN